jgi:hypothetical protein
MNTTPLEKALEAAPSLAFALVLVWLWMQNGAQNKAERESRDRLWQEFFAMQRELDRAALAELAGEIVKLTAAVSGMQAALRNDQCRMTNVK